jgi:uncharacterized membrane protein
MSAGKRVAIFIIVVIIISAIATFLKKIGTGPVLSISFIAIAIIYRAMFYETEEDQYEEIEVEEEVEVDDDEPIDEIGDTEIKLKK